MNDVERNKSVGSHHVEEKELREKAVGHSEVLVDASLMNEAFAAEDAEHEMTFMQAVKAHPYASAWALLFCFTIVMESFDMFLNGNFVALATFKERFGVDVYDAASGTVVKSIETKWQSALFQAGQCGAFVGVLVVGPINNRLGYRWTIMLGLMILNATIFVSYFAESLGVLVAGQFLEGIPWGFFIGVSPAYASEVVPIALRGPITCSLQAAWSIGGILVGGATYATNQFSGDKGWKIPLALQWMFPTPLLLLVFFAPESPWWLVRKGKKEQALKSLKRLGKEGKHSPEATLAVIERTVEIERQHGSASFSELWKGTDLRRTTIICLMYASQNFAGNLIANQAVYFFTQAGMSQDFAFQLGLINSCLGLVANISAWGLTAWFGRRTIYLWGTAVNICFLMILGVCASITQSTSTNYAQAVLGVLISFVFAGAMGPTSYTIISETSSVRLRALSTAVGRAAYYVAEIPMIYLASQLLNTTGWNVAGKCGYVWGATACVCWVMAYFFLPEMKHRSYRELDILFARKVHARQFKHTFIDVKENE